MSRAPTRLLILTAPIGGGHLAVAGALANVVFSEDPTVDVSVRSLATEQGWLRDLPRSYSVATSRLSWLWAAYYYSRRPRSVRALNGWIARPPLRQAISRICEEQCDGILVTHSLYCHVLRELRAITHNVSVVVTDLYGGPMEWFTPGATRYIVPTPEYAATARQQLPGERIVVRRLPTLVARSSSVRWRPSVALRVLVVGGAEGVGPIVDIAQGLVASGRPIVLSLVCGANRTLAARAVRGLGSHVTVLGPLPNLRDHLAMFDLVVTKPGSVTISECIDAGVPFWLMPGIPGIERNNLAALRRHGIPVARDRNSARAHAEMLIRPDLSLSLEGERWVEAVARVGQAMPPSTVRLRDLT